MTGIDYLLDLGGKGLNLLDYPGALARNVAAGKSLADAFDVNPFTHENRTYGGDVLRHWGAPIDKEDTWSNLPARLGVELALDPLNWLGGAGLIRKAIQRGRVAEQNAAKLGEHYLAAKAIDADNAANKALRAKEFDDYVTSNKAAMDSNVKLVAYNRAGKIGDDVLTQLPIPPKKASDTVTRGVYQTIGGQAWNPFEKWSSRARRFEGGEPTDYINTNTSTWHIPLNESYGNAVEPLLRRRLTSPGVDVVAEAADDILDAMRRHRRPDATMKMIQRPSQSRPVLRRMHVERVRFPGEEEIEGVIARRGNKVVLDQSPRFAHVNETDLSSMGLKVVSDTPAFRQLPKYDTPQEISDAIRKWKLMQPERFGPSELRDIEQLTRLEVKNPLDLNAPDLYPEFFPDTDVGGQGFRETQAKIIRALRRKIGNQPSRGVARAFAANMEDAWRPHGSIPTRSFANAVMDAAKIHGVDAGDLFEVFGFDALKDYIPLENLRATGNSLRHLDPILVEAGGGRTIKAVEAIQPLRRRQVWGPTGPLGLEPLPPPPKPFVAQPLPVKPSFVDEFGFPGGLERLPSRKPLALAMGAYNAAANASRRNAEANRMRGITALLEEDNE